jgi:prevent-host-death family protein
VVSKVVPVRELRSDLARLLDDVADRREHVVVTRRGRPAAVLIPVDEYDALEDTAEILADAEALAAIEVGLAEVERGETTTLAELRAQVAGRRRAG